jgi:hypothetical protein
LTFQWPASLYIQLSFFLIVYSVCPVSPGNHIRNLIQHCEPAALPTYSEYSDFLDPAEGSKKKEPDKSTKDSETESEVEEPEIEVTPFLF